MKTPKLIAIPALVLAGMLAFQPAWADKGGKGNSGNKHDKSERNDKGERGDGNDKQERSERRDHFEDRHRGVARTYYDDEFRHGRCPPGLAKKHNGCLPPGQAKKWQVGQHLPRDVVYYSIPQPLLVQFGPPPTGYRYVRVGSDILLLSTATRTILDIIVNLGRG